MIRINLLPVREAQQKQTGKQLLALFAVLIVLEVGALFWFQGEKSAELDAIKKRNKAISDKITELKKKTDAVADLENQKAELEKQKTVLDGLIEGQSGPVRMLHELSQILTPIEDPQKKLEVLEKGWNPDWDPRRLWLDGFVERNRAVKISGHARTNEDLAEFLQRLGSSRHFVEINLNVSEAVELANLNRARLVRFDIDALVIYGPADVKKLAEGTLGQKK
jgi:type IV pilus assembly protein PilN